MRRAPLRIAAILAALPAAVSISVAPAQTQDDGPGVPQPDRSVRDPEFGVIARHYGLERRVEMLQWRRVDGGYATTWSELPIDSTTFSEQHRNPPGFPLQSRRWTAATITIDGKPLDPSVVGALGQWRLFRPSFSALPANLAATFQPEGDGLGSADNPLEPHVGDLRIHWRELVLPPLEQRIALRDGRWQLAAPPSAADTPTPTIVGNGAAAPAVHPHRAWWFGGAFVALVAALAARRRRSRNARG
ncbi:MAG: TMEM43 family protein [Luteimonas sp.]